MRYILFTTTRCPKCPEFKDFVSRHLSFSGEVLDETRSDFSEKIAQYGVTQAPSIIFLEDRDQEVFRTNELSALKDFLKTLER